MEANKMLGCCLIILGVINTLHEIQMRVSGSYRPGVGYAIVTALFITLGAAFLLRRRIYHKR